MPQPDQYQARDSVERFSAGASAPSRAWWKSAWRGLTKRCPSCGSGKLFDGYVRVSDECPSCAERLSGHRADDAPPYLTIMIVGHLCIPLALATKQIFDPPLGMQFAIWLPTMIAMTFWLLPAMKGLMIGIQWANYMHGFGEEPDACWPSEAGLDIRNSSEKA